MNLAKVIGIATSTIKHPSLKGWKLLVVQPIDINGRADGSPLLAIDDQGGRRGDTVILTSDGAAVREMVKNSSTPIRWAVMGIADE